MKPIKRRLKLRKVHVETLARLNQGLQTCRYQWGSCSLSRSHWPCFDWVNYLISFQMWAVKPHSPSLLAARWVNIYTGVQSLSPACSWVVLLLVLCLLQWSSKQSSSHVGFCHLCTKMCLLTVQLTALGEVQSAVVCMLIECNLFTAIIRDNGK